MQHFFYALPTTSVYASFYVLIYHATLNPIPDITYRIILFGRFDDDSSLSQNVYKATSYHFEICRVANFQDHEAFVFLLSYLVLEFSIIS